jgi:hypothetical protein
MGDLEKENDALKIQNRALIDSLNALTARVAALEHR